MSHELLGPSDGGVDCKRLYVQMSRISILDTRKAPNECYWLQFEINGAININPNTCLGETASVVRLIPASTKVPWLRCVCQGYPSVNGFFYVGRRFFGRLHLKAISLNTILCSF